MAFTDLLLPFLIKRKIRGRDRLYSLLINLGFRSNVILKAKYNILLSLNPREYIDNIIIKEGFYESEVTDEILKNLNDDGVFWDIGANIGIHSIAVKKNCKNVKVYCFEPNPIILGNLYNNIKINALDINVCAFALYDSIGPMKLHLADGNSGMATLTPWHEITFSSSVRCLTTTGDHLIAMGFDSPNVIKIDTEGSELNVLKGLEKLLLGNVLKVVIYEAHNNLLGKLHTDETVIFLTGFGFNKIIHLSRNENTEHGLSNFAFSKS